MPPAEPRLFLDRSAGGSVRSSQDDNPDETGPGLPQHFRGFIDRGPRGQRGERPPRQADASGESSGESAEGEGGEGQAGRHAHGIHVQLAIAVDVVEQGQG